MAAIFFLWLVLAMGEVDARGSARDTILATFNTALTTRYPEIEERAAIVMDQCINFKLAVGYYMYESWIHDIQPYFLHTVYQLQSSCGLQHILKSDVDIFCLQGVWYADIQRQIYNGVKDYYPYVLSAVDLTDSTVSSEPACTRDTLNQFLQCQTINCAAFADSLFQTALCTALSCVQVMTTFPEHCLLCLQREFLEPNQYRCLTDPASRYQKTYGLMMLSTKELETPLVQGQNNQSQQRGLLTATVNGVGDLLCTLLTPNPTPILGDVYIGPPTVFPLLYSSYAEQQYDEVLRVIDFATSVDVPVLMGDFNHGPAAPGGIIWDFPLHYGLMTARGFYSPYVLRDGRCTWCLENAQAASFLPFNYIIDHIYITTNTMERVRSVERIFDNVFTESGLRLSEHFGVKMTLSNVRKNCNPFQRCWFFCESEIEELLPLPPPDRGQLCAP